MLDTLNVWYPASGVAPVQAVEYTSVASAPVAVPNAWFGLFCSGVQKSVADNPTIRLYPYDNLDDPTTTLFVPAVTFVLAVFAPIILL